MLDFLSSDMGARIAFILASTVVIIVLLIVRSFDRSDDREASRRGARDTESAISDLKSEIRYLRQEMPKKKP